MRMKLVGLVLATALVAVAPLVAATGWSLRVDEGAAGEVYFGIPKRTPKLTIVVPVDYPDGALLYPEFFDLLTGPDRLPTSPIKKVLVAEKIKGNRVTNRIFVRRHLSGRGGIELPPLPAGYRVQIIPKMFRVARKEGLWAFRARLEPMSPQSASGK